MKTFTDYESWKAAAIEQGLTVDVQSPKGYPDPADLHVPVLAVDNQGNPVGCYAYGPSWEQEEKLQEAVAGGAMTEAEADAAYNALPNVVDAVLCENADKYMDYIHDYTPPADGPSDPYPWSPADTSPQQ